MKPGETIELEGKTYVAVAEPKGDEVDELCEGCVALDSTILCRKLPECNEIIFQLKDQPAPLRFKVLKHKTLENTFGVFFAHYNDNTEIFQSDIPELLGIKTTVDDLIYLYNDKTAIEQLSDYDLVEVKIM